MTILWGGLAIRALLLAWVLLTGHWHGGDTGHYVWVSGLVCEGEWGGALGRPTLYAWFLCVLSPFLKPGHATSGSVALPLLIQSMAVWFCGVLVWRLWPKISSRKAVVALWMFDPVLLVFGALVMSDIIFSILALLLAIVSWLLWRERRDHRRSLYYAVATGVLLGALVLTRSVAYPLLFWSAACGVLMFWRRLRVLTLVFVAAIGVMAPQIYWNGTRYGNWGVITQGGWFETVIAVVEYASPAIDPYEAEARWIKDPRYGNQVESRKILMSKFPTFLALTAKGIARVLVGHVNVEWGTVMLGEAPVGPGWFKAPEPRAGPHVSGFWVLPWVLGILLTAAISIFAYWKTFRALLTAGMDLHSSWLLGTVVLLAFTPLVWGDARFRVAIWPFVLVLWATAEARALNKTKRS
jgi:hypothetical protein